jgi:hypothetical protein
MKSDKKSQNNGRFLLLKTLSRIGEKDNDISASIYSAKQLNNFFRKQKSALIFFL